MVKQALLSILALVLLSCTVVRDDSVYRVVEVIDGDTVRLATGEFLRYIGIDTPEIRVRQGSEFIYSPQPFSLESREYNRLLVEGKTVEIEFDVEKKDRYGRLLGYCFVDGIFVNAKLIEEGYAVLYTYPPNVKYTGLFVELQKEARAAQKGLWQSYKIISAGEAVEYIGEIGTVRGKVLNTYQSAKCVFLNFGDDWQSDFTVVIFNNCLDGFRKQGIDPVSFYRGKRVEVTGRIREYNGPEIIVNSPHELTLVED